MTRRGSTVARGKFVRGPKRQTTWVGPADQAYVSVVSTGATLLSSFDARADGGMVSPTLIRSRGMLSVKPSTFGSDLTIVGAFGIAIVTDVAFAAGIGSLPKPFDDAEWGGWLVWQPFSYFLEFMDATGFAAPADREYEVDSKVMRKVSNDETVVLIAQSQVGAFDISSPIWTLWKLS